MTRFYEVTFVPTDGSDAEPFRRGFAVETRTEARYWASLRNEVQWGTHRIGRILIHTVGTS